MLYCDGLPPESSGAARAPPRGPWMCGGNLGAEGPCAPSRGPRCSQPRAKLENEKVECNHPVF